MNNKFSNNHKSTNTNNTNNNTNNIKTENNNKRYLEFLAENETYKKLLNSREQKNWLNQAYFLKGNITSDKNSLRDTRNYFLKTIASENSNAKILSCKDNYKNLENAGLTLLPEIKNLTDYSAIISLDFELLSPLLTHDDDSFYLFDNPVKKDHIFGVPYLAAASMKGLTFDAFLRAFPADNWENLGKKDSDRTIAYRSQKNKLSAQAAKRLFGVADNAETNLQDDSKSQVGRLHFAPIWFKYIQYLVMNPSSEKNSMPIQFEAIAAEDSDKKTVKATINFWYINKIDGEESSELEVRADLALLLEAMSEWLPALGLGAKRLAGYGAIKPLTAIFKGKNFSGELSKEITENSWKKLAEKLANIN